MKIFNFRKLLTLILFLQIGCSYTDQDNSDNRQYDNSDNSNNSSDIEINNGDSNKPQQVPYIENFNTTLDTSVWTKSNNIEKNPVPAVTTLASSYIHKETSTIKLSYYNSTLSKTVNIYEPSAITFSFYPDGNYSGQKLYFYINNNEQGSWNGIGARQTYTFLLEKAGKYELKWKTTGPYGLKGMGNEVYLDCVSIVADKTDNIAVYPKGVQTVAVGESITYTAKALRVDGSEINGKDITKDFTATATGEQTFAMEIDGKTADVKVNVVSADYITEPIFYMGKTYNGIISTVNGSSENINKDSDIPNLNDSAKLEVSYPTGNSFDTDGFFPLKLNINNPDYNQFIGITISDGTNSKTYLYRGNPDNDSGELETRIWLRWGKGNYLVKLYDIVSLNWKYEDYDKQKNTSADGVIFRGDNIASFGYHKNYPAVTFTVNNTRDEDGTWLYPSSVVQADDIRIINKATDLTAGLDNVESKVKAIHDWIVTSKHYDNDSLIQGCRKRQDAVAVMEYNTGVCEGYANLASAMLRSLGIQTKYISSDSLSHGWNHVNIGTVENPDWRMMDCTWDDPNIAGTGDGGSFFVTYDNYLLENHTGGSEAHIGGLEDNSRNITSITVGHIDGVENIAY